MGNERNQYLFGILAVAIILLIGIGIVRSRLPVSSINRVSGLGIPLTTSTYDPTATGDIGYVASAPNDRVTVANAPTGQDPASFSYDTTPSAETTAKAIIKSDTPFDFGAFMEPLSTTPTTPDTSQIAHKAVFYALPSSPNLPSITVTNAAPPKRTAIQESLAIYGNTAGGIMRSYERSHTNAASVIESYFKARDDAAKTTALVQLGNDMVTLGTDLKKIPDLPSPIATAHSALSDDYINMGNKLIAVPSEPDIITAVNSYNQAVDSYIKHFAAIAVTFPMYTVTFEPSEPGSLFLFSSAQGF